MQITANPMNPVVTVSGGFYIRTQKEEVRNWGSLTIHQWKHPGGSLQQSERNSAVGRNYLMAFAVSKHVKASGLWVHSDEIHLIALRVFHKTPMRVMDGYQGPRIARGSLAWNPQHFSSAQPWRFESTSRSCIFFFSGNLRDLTCELWMKHLLSLSLTPNRVAFLFLVEHFYQ